VNYAAIVLGPHCTEDETHHATQSQPDSLPYLSCTHRLPGGNTVPRRLVVTPSSLITRRVDSHEVVLRRPLNAVAAVVRFADDPKLLAVEWEDGAPPCQFVTPARDAVLAALLSAAQAASGRPIAVMPGGWGSGCSGLRGWSVCLFCWLFLIAGVCAKYGGYVNQD
jgi:hypothetical protein